MNCIAIKIFVLFKKRLIIQKNKFKPDNSDVEMSKNILKNSYNDVLVLFEELHEEFKKRRP